MSGGAAHFRYLPADVLGLTQRQRLLLTGGRLPGAWTPRQLEAWPEPASAGLEPATCARLAAYLAGYEPHVATLDAVRRLEEPNALTVVAPVRPGLLGGPLANLFAAIHAVRLATALSERWNRPVEALAWICADEVRYAEARSAQVVDEAFDRPRVALQAIESQAGCAVGEVIVETELHGLDSLRAQLSTSLDCDLDFESRWLAAGLPRAGESLAQATARVLLEALGHRGLLVAEPACLRGELGRALAGLVTPSDPAAHAGSAPWVYQLLDGIPRELGPGGEGFQYAEEAGSRTASELAAEIVQDPRSWAPAPVLRAPTVARCLSTVAWLAGPSELDLDWTLTPAPPAVVPRATATLIGAEDTEALARLGWTLEEGIRRLSQPPGPPPADESTAVSARLEQIGTEAGAAVLALRPDLARLDPGLAARLRQLGARLEGLVADLAERVRRVETNDAATERRHVRRLSASLRPGGRPQATVESVLVGLLSHGDAWIDPLIARLDPLPVEHLAVFPTGVAGS